MRAAGELKRLQSSGPAAQQFLAEVSRILEEGNARQESSEEMTGKIAHAASVNNLPSLSSHAPSREHCTLTCQNLFFVVCCVFSCESVRHMLDRLAATCTCQVVARQASKQFLPCLCMCTLLGCPHMVQIWYNLVPARSCPHCICWSRRCSPPWYTNLGASCLDGQA